LRQRFGTVIEKNKDATTGVIDLGVRRQSQIELKYRIDSSRALLVLRIDLKFSATDGT